MLVFQAARGSPERLFGTILYEFGFLVKGFFQRFLKISEVPSA